jgi:cyclic pyranopterin phosphate synthase
MPMGDLGEEDRLDQFWSLRDVRARLAERWTLTDTAERTGGPARYARIEETGQRIGFITPLSHNFCESCNRVRLTCTGQLYMCLGQDDDADLRRVLRAHGDGPAGDTALEAAIREAITRKPRGHDFDYSRSRVEGQVARHMSVTGG